MNKHKYISTTLPYINSTPHIGHCFEFVLADVIAEYHRRKGYNVFFNVGIDEHGQKVYNKAKEIGFSETQDYCDNLADTWIIFCDALNINYDNFYRTTAPEHKANVLRFYREIEWFLKERDYTGNYCIGCESFVTDKEAVDGCCPIHKTELTTASEKNKFFDLSLFEGVISDVLVDKSKSKELRSLLESKFDLSITRQNVEWGIQTPDGDVLYVWFEALLNYIFSIKFYEDRDSFNQYWGNSLIICGKDNLKFQAYILQALLHSRKIPQTSEILVHGNILDIDGNKLSKSAGNSIDPLQDIERYGSDAVRYYLACGLNTFSDSKYSAQDLIDKWNNDIVNGLGNLISRLLHLIDIRKVDPLANKLSKEAYTEIDNVKRSIILEFDSYNLNVVGKYLNERVSKLNSRITNERPFDAECENYEAILNEVYWELRLLVDYYKLILKNHADELDNAFVVNKKVIIFSRL